jgi:hypothetical protein
VNSSARLENWEIQRESQAYREVRTGKPSIAEKDSSVAIEGCDWGIDLNLRGKLYFFNF